MQNFSVDEQQLFLLLEYIMVKHRYNCSSFESISTSNAIYLYRIKKALLKSKVEEKRIAVLRSIIEDVNERINRGMLFKEIFEPLPAIISDKLRNYRKGEFSKNKEAKKVEEGKSFLDDYKSEEQKRVDFLTFKVDEICNRFTVFTRPELQNLETNFNELIRNSTSYYGVNHASVEILGNLYTGMIETTRKNFEKFLRENYGVVLNKNDRLSDQMSDELLLYKVVALYYTNVMCSKRLNKIRPDLDSNYINKDAYKVLTHDVYLLGNVVRTKYLNKFGISPKDELIENYVGGQLSFDDIIKQRKK